MRTPSQLDASRRYDQLWVKGLYIKLNMRTERDIIEWTYRQKAVSTSIKKLIREAIAKEACQQQEPGP